MPVGEGWAVIQIKSWNFPEASRTCMFVVVVAGVSVWDFSHGTLHGSPRVSNCSNVWLYAYGQCVYEGVRTGVLPEVCVCVHDPSRV
jgi:hypothetical protein